MALYHTLRAMLGAFDAGSRRSGRTLHMLRQVRQDDIVICLNHKHAESNAIALRHLYRDEFPNERCPYVKFVVHPVDRPLFDCQALHGVGARLYFDHSWELAYYEHIIAGGASDLEGVRKILADKLPAHRRITTLVDQEYRP